MAPGKDIRVVGIGRYMGRYIVPVRIGKSKVPTSLLRIFFCVPISSY